MSRMAQGLVLVLLGAAALSATLAGDLYLNYVQAAFRPFLITAGGVLVALGAVVVAADVRAAVRGDGADDGGDPVESGGQDHHDHGAAHGHDHAHGPGVAWLLLLPVIAVFAVSPPALGAYTAANAQSEPPSGAALQEPADADALAASAPPEEPVELKLREFVVRAWTDEERSLAGRTVRLTGFVVPNDSGEGWYLARLQMACCAADAIVNRVLITNEPAPQKDSWWTVEGQWVEPEGKLLEVRDHRFEVAQMTEVVNPPDPYE
ncbi:TIGR03943 family putative permease subunit [Salinactinospora qingdaonensis]|uniref:TIGR03943 family protein n=1 Tax=Salinactinospora qingdaonensis TaxID=702744 RepID=A0ABP7EZZ1_9ACTN